VRTAEMRSCRLLPVAMRMASVYVNFTL
jgi:hypothetical protein